MFDLTGSMSDAAPGAVKKFADLKTAYLAAPSDDARAAAWSALWHHASAVANWRGLIPAATVLISLPAGFLAGCLVSLGRPKNVEPSKPHV